MELASILLFCCIFATSTIIKKKHEFKKHFNRNYLILIHNILHSG